MKIAVRASWRDHVVGAVLCTGYLALLMASSVGLGMSRDESFYVDAANRYAAWFTLLSEDSARAMDHATIDAHWNANHEHPSLAKSMFALGHLAQERWEIFELPSQPYRFFGMLSSGLLLWLIYIFGVQLGGRSVGLFAALAFGFMPRIFYHSQLDAFDVPIVLMMTLVAYCYWRSLHDWRWTFATAVAFGLALETKHNAWTLPAILWVHWAFVVVCRRSAEDAPLTWRSRGFTALACVGPLLAFGVAFFVFVLVPVLELPLVNIWWVGLVAFPAYLGLLYYLAKKSGVTRWQRYVPVAWVAMVWVGPLLFIALWPWMWFDTAIRFREYASFHLNHVHYNMAYFGVNYFGPPLPISFPWVMTLFTVPLTVLSLAGFGLLRRLRALLRDSWLADVLGIGEPEPDDAQTDVLMAGLMLAPMVVISMPWTPIFGGTKHWFAAYPFVALFAGIGFRELLAQLGDFWTRLKGPFTSLKGAPLSFLAGALMLTPPLIETYHSDHFGLSHYTVAAGGVPGAADYGMNRQFWGFTTGSLVGWLNAEMPNGGTVWPCDTTWTAWRMLQQDGLLNDNIRAAADLYSADYAIVHHEHHFVDVDYNIWALWGSVQPVHVMTYDGVPIISVYENPRRRAARAR